MKRPLLQQIQAARRVSTPLVAIETTDPGATLRMLVDGLEASNGGPPAFLQWDTAAGLRSLNAAGKAALVKLGGAEVAESTTGSPGELLDTIAPKLPEGAILAIHAAGRWLDPQTSQAVWNLRDLFKADRRMLLLLGSEVKLPPELAGDVLTFAEPLPDADAIRAILAELLKADGAPTVNAATIEAAADALAGLSAFRAEQVAAMSLTRDGLDVDACWEQKRQMIDRTPGLSVQRDAEPFAKIGGVRRVIQLFRDLFRPEAKRRARCIVIVDEIDKSPLAAGANDTSGVSQDQLGYTLSWMEEHRAAGAIFVGPPGSAKSMVAKAAGAFAGIPTIILDLGAAKGSLVGESERQLRDALRVIDAISGGATFWVATCNSAAKIPPALRRRFTCGIYFFDIPTDDERAAIWPIHLDAYGLATSKHDRPADTDWTGAEIRQCCDLADRLDVGMIEAAGYVIPTAQSAPDDLERLRRAASGRFHSASEPGVYRLPGDLDHLKTGPRRLAQ